MNLLPLVNRELRTAVRRRRSYRLRLAFAGTSICISLWVLLVWSGWTSGATLGITLLHVMAQAGFLGILLTGIILTADCVTRERREATLGLLWVAGLKPHELVLGKLAGKVVVPFYALIGMLPGFAVSSIVGGVTGGEFWRLLAVLLNTLWWSLSAGMLASSFCQQQRTAYSSALMLVLIGAGGIPMFGQWAGSTLGNPLWAELAGLFSPAGAYLFAYDQRYSAGPLWFWGSLVCTHVLAWLGLGLACAFVAYSAYVETESSEFNSGRRFRMLNLFGSLERWSKRTSKRSNRRRSLDAAASNQDRDNMAGPAAEGPAQSSAGGKVGLRNLEAELRASNPIAWLASRRRGGLFLIWCPVLAAAWLLCVSDLSPFGNAQSKAGFLVWFALHLLLEIWMAGDAAHSFANDRKSGALELLLGTRLDVREIAAGLLRALRQRFIRPILTLFTLDVLLALRMFASQDPISGIFVGVGAVLFLLGCYSVLWVGVWQAMVSSHPAVATLNGAVRILVLPWVWFGIVAGLFAQSSLVELAVAWAFLSAGNSLIFFRGARHRLLEHFRELALKPYGEKPPHIESDWSAINWEPDGGTENVEA